MGQVLKFERRPEKLTGFIPPTLGEPPRTVSDPFTSMLISILAIGAISLVIFQVWFREGWRDR